MISLNAATPSFQQAFTNFASSGKLDLEGASKRDLSPAEAKDMYVQFKDQMDQTIGLDQIPQADSNPEPGQITSDAFGKGVELNASFEGNTDSGTVALSIQGKDISSQAVAQFMNGRLVVLQEAAEGSDPTATFGAVLDPSGASYMMSKNAPDDMTFG